MLRNFRKKITDRGVTPDLDFNIKNKIRIFNSSIFVIGSIYLFYTFVGYFRGHYLASFLTFLAWGISAFCLYLMSKRKYEIAYHLTVGLGLAFLFTFSMLYADSNLTYVFFLFIPVASIVLFDDFRICFIYFILTIISIIAAKIFFLGYKPYYPDEELNTYLGFLNIILTCGLLYLAVRMFKFENLIYSKEINQQRKMLEEKNKDITDSITYAKRIQKALMASESVLNKNLPEHFVLYKPKDIVSGDFYWADLTPGPSPGGEGGKFLIATCDCTGHGVPGAFMSLLGVSFLNEITKERRITQPDLVFDHLRDDIIRALNPEGNKEEGKDGMDAVLCSFDFQKMEMLVCCANNPLWVLRNREWIEIKPDKFPIGMQGERLPFTLHNFPMQKGDLIYTFTDGYADQFGGEKGKKFKYKNVQQLLLDNSDKTMTEQKKILEFTIENWKGKLEQVDDILVIGIKI